MSNKNYETGKTSKQKLRALVCLMGKENLFNILKRMFPLGINAKVCF